MGDYVVKIKNNHYRNDGDIRRLFAYIAGEGKNAEKENAVSVRGYGISNNHIKASEQIIRIQKLYGKNRERRCYHMVVSFEKEVDDLNFVILAADAIAYMIFAEMHFQVFYGIHTSTDHLHIHYAINAVNYKSGRKWHQNNTETKAFIEKMQSRIKAVYCDMV